MRVKEFSELGIRYVTERGVSLEFAVAHGIEETGPDLELLSHRLGHGFSSEELGQIQSLIWFQGPNGGYLARILGEYRNKDGKIQRYLFSTKGGHAPWIPAATLDVAKSPEPVIFTEAFFKGLVVLHAGGLPIAFNGPWVSETTASSEDGKPNNRVLAKELSAFNFRGRSVYLAFDQDQATNESVRNAAIRAWMLLEVQSAAVYVLLWSGHKGIDDYLAAVAGIDPLKQKEVLGELIANAKLFKETLIKGAGGDAELVRAELRKVKMANTQREALALEAAAACGVTKESLLEGCEKERKGKSGRDRKVLFAELEPWPERVDGQVHLANLVALEHKHVHLLNDYAVTKALYEIFAFLVQQDYVEKSPYLGITAPTKGCGKSRCTDLMKELVWRGHVFTDPSEAVFYRLCEQHQPTFIIDEVHKFLPIRPGLLGLLLAAYDRDRPVPRYNTETGEIETFDIWSAKGLTYLGALDDQLQDRVIEIRLEKKSRQIIKSPLRDTPHEYFHELRRKSLRWAQDNAEAVGAFKPIFLETDNDRAADNWKWLIAIAGVIDPDNVNAVVEIALRNEKQTGSIARASNEDLVLEGVEQAYRDVCEAKEWDFDNPRTDFFMTFKSVSWLMNKDDTAPWKTSLAAMPPLARKKSLLLILRLAHPSVHEFLKAELQKLSGVEVDPDWLATVDSDPKIS